MKNLLFSLLATVSLLPPIIISLQSTKGGEIKEGKNVFFWISLVIALTITLLWVLMNIFDSWKPGISITLWVIIAASVTIFTFINLINDIAWRLSPLLFSYLLILSVFAFFWQNIPETENFINELNGWVIIHIIVSVATYALVTIASFAALAAFLKERALKTKKQVFLSWMLPSVSESERLMVLLLIVGEIILGLGLATGLATQFQKTGSFIEWDHKVILSSIAFGIIAILLTAQIKSGIRGQRVTRYVLLAYIFLTLSYPGVKFVTDVLIN